MVMVMVMMFLVDRLAAGRSEEAGEIVLEPKGFTLRSLSTASPHDPTRLDRGPTHHTTHTIPRRPD